MAACVEGVGSTPGAAIADLRKKLEKAVTWLKIHDMDVEILARIEPEREADGKFHAWWRLEI